MATAQLSGILGAISGDLGNFNFRNTKNGTVIADRREKKNAPSTTEQLLARAFFSTASKQWKTLTDAQRQAWDFYASAYFKTNRNNKGNGPNGQAVYLKAAWYLQAAGAPLPTSAPMESPPAAPTGLTVLPSSNDTTLSIRATHTLATVAGHRLYVEMTPALPSPARKPQPYEYRAAKGLNSGSFPDLAPVANPTSFSDIRFPQPNGARFGCRVTIISGEGIPSAPFAAVLTQRVS